MRVRRRLEPTPERDALQDIAHALLRDRRELALALHQQHPREPERVHAQLLARAREHVRLVPPGHDVDVLEREQDVDKGPDRGHAYTDVFAPRDIFHNVLVFVSYTSCDG